MSRSASLRLLGPLTDVHLRPSLERRTVVAPYAKMVEPARSNLETLQDLTLSNAPPPVVRRMPDVVASRTVVPLVITAVEVAVVPGTIGCQLEPPLTVRNRPPRTSSA